MSKMAKYVCIDDEFYERLNQDSYTLYDWSDSIDIDDVRKIIESLPTVDAEPVVHAHWEEVYGYVTPGGDPVWVCSNCGKGMHVWGVEASTYNRDISDSRQWVACPNCGAKMDEVEK